MSSEGMSKMSMEDDGEEKPASEKNSIAQRRKLFKMKPSLSVDVNCTKILPYLYLGGYEVTTDKRMMQDTLKITHIVNVTTESECHFLDDFKYAHIKLSDSTDRSKANLLAILDEAFECIEDAKRQDGAALVHCQVGMSRSASVVIAYLMFSEGMTLHKAFVLVKGKRPVTAPNYGFMEQLVEYEQKLFDGTVTFDLAKYKQHRFKDASLFELSDEQGGKK